jgi:predicted transcriptional regulator
MANIVFLINRLDKMYNAVPQEIRNEFAGDMQQIRNELSKKTTALQKITSIYGKIYMGKVDNKAALKSARDIARKALK